MQSNRQPTVAIILLNYGGAQDTIECIKSLQKISYPNYNIVIVDNASPDDSIEKMEKYFKFEAHVNYSVFNSPHEAMLSNQPQQKFTILQAGYNGGYGHGNNIGIKFALKNEVGYVLVLNNDTIVDPGFLEPLVQICEKDENIGIVGGQIYFLDRPDTFWFNGGSFNSCTGRIVHHDINKQDKGDKPLENNTFITGCMWLIPVEVFKTVGFINEGYSMYVEDLEFTQRVLQKGYALKVLSESKIYHAVGGSSGGGESAFSAYWMTKNWLSFMQKHMKIICWPLGFINGILRAFLKALLHMRFDLLSAHIKGIYDFFVKR